MYRQSNKATRPTTALLKGTAERGGEKMQDGYIFTEPMLLYSSVFNLPNVVTL